MTWNTERRRTMLLVPCMVVCNLFLLLCMVGLGIVGLNGGKGLGVLSLGADPNQQIVEAYLAQRVPSDRYRIRQWFPSEPLDLGLAANTDTRSGPAAFSQRVKLVFYGPNGARELDTVYWVQNGRVTRTLSQ
ncbi:MAG: hypothetical protein HUU20_16510 [Pirellulales bacterium]|nr:hypothetical protein [Pirellulales bacterium]